MQALLCDSALHRVIVAGRSSILDYGTATRTFPVNPWNALVIRDRHCRFPGCDRSPRMCHGHHVVPFEQWGPTKLTNLASCEYDLSVDPGLDAEFDRFDEHVDAGEGAAA